LLRDGFLERDTILTCTFQNILTPHGRVVSLSEPSKVTFAHILAESPELEIGDSFLVEFSSSFRGSVVSSSSFDIGSRWEALLNGMRPNELQLSPEPHNFPGPSESGSDSIGVHTVQSGIYFASPASRPLGSYDPQVPSPR